MIQSSGTCCRTARNYAVTNAEKIKDKHWVVSGGRLGKKTSNFHRQVRVERSRLDMSFETETGMWSSVLEAYTRYSCCVSHPEPLERREPES